MTRLIGLTIIAVIGVVAGARGVEPPANSEKPRVPVAIVWNSDGVFVASTVGIDGAERVAAAVVDVGVDITSAGLLGSAVPVVAALSDTAFIFTTATGAANVAAVQQLQRNAAVWNVAAAPDLRGRGGGRISPGEG